MSFLGKTTVIFISCSFALLRSKPPEFLKQEIYSRLILYNFGIFIANEAAEENRKKKRDGSNKYLYEALFFSLLNTAKCTILSICILSIGLIYKNYKNPNNSYRIFHLVFYSLLAFSVIANFVLLLNTEYKYFLLNTSISTSSKNLLDNFLLSEAPIFLILLIGFIIICIYKLSHACIFGEYKSSRMRINFQHITERILAPIIYLFGLDIIIHKKYVCSKKDKDNRYYYYHWQCH